MPYNLEITEAAHKVFFKLAKKDSVALDAIEKKVAEILGNPYHYEPLRAPLQNKRRVHIASSFVLIFEIDENRKTVKLLEFDHHDNAYHHQKEMQR
jgi:YafQ family addiction module toxin component